MSVKDINFHNQGVQDKYEQKHTRLIIVKWLKKERERENFESSQRKTRLLHTRVNTTI